MHEPQDPKPSQKMAELNEKLACLHAHIESLSETAARILMQARQLASADMDQEPDWQGRKAA